MTAFDFSMLLESIHHLNTCMVEMNEQTAQSSILEERMASLLEKILEVRSAKSQRVQGKTPESLAESSGKLPEHGFSGEDTNLDVPGFLAQFQSYFHLHPESFPSDVAKVEFLGRYLDGKAGNWYKKLRQMAEKARLDPDKAEPSEKEAYNTVSNWDVFLTKFKNVFTLFTRLRTLEQTGSFKSYATQFSCLCMVLAEEIDKCMVEDMLDFSETSAYNTKCMHPFILGLSADVKSKLTDDQLHYVPMDNDDLCYFGEEINERLESLSKGDQPSDSDWVVSSSVTSSRQTPSCSGSTSSSLTAAETVW
jgi:hypothetical protein